MIRSLEQFMSRTFDTLSTVSFIDYFVDDIGINQ